MSSADDAPEPEDTEPEDTAPEDTEPEDTTSEADSAPVDEPAPVDDERLVLVEALVTELGEDVVGRETSHDDTWLRVERAAWGRTAEVCRKLGFDYFCFLSGIDWAPSTSQTRGEVSATVEDEDGDAGEASDDAEAGPTGDAEAAAYPSTTDDEAADGPKAWETGVAGGDTRFQVLARLYSTRRKVGVTLKADLDDEAPAVDSWSAVYPGADWHERETAEMFGFDFVGHPNLIHLYLPGEFEGFPLRKDFPLLSREVKPWPGLVDVEPMPEEAEAQEDGAQEAEAQEDGADDGEASAASGATTEGSDS